MGTRDTLTSNKDDGVVLIVMWGGGGILRDLLINTVTCVTCVFLTY